MEDYYKNLFDSYGIRHFGKMKIINGEITTVLRVANLEGKDYSKIEVKLVEKIKNSLLEEKGECNERD